MDKLNICIDIDGTITEPYYWIDDANEYFKTDIKPEDVTKYQLHEILGVTYEEYLTFYDIYKEKLHTKETVREYGREVLWSLKKNHNIYYVTARIEELRDITVKWFKENNLPLSELYMLGSFHKSDKAKELKCDIFIEDSWENAVELAKEGFYVLLIDTNYNRKPLIEGMKRVCNWKDIEKEVNLYSKLNISDDVESA